MEDFPKIFGEWTALAKNPSRRNHWVCKCACGVEKSVDSRSLKSGTSKSCRKCGQTRRNQHKGFSKDITGEVFGRLTVKNFDSLTSTPKQKFWNCLCECGVQKSVSRKNLVSGHTQSCGCFRVESRTKHGKANSQTYRIWAAMVARCTNTNGSYYHRYGGRGITVSVEWLEFSNFYTDMGDRPKGLTLDRKDNDLGYCKENCQWTTVKEQARNRSTNLCFTVNGETKPLIVICEDLKLPYLKVYAALRRGYTFEETIARYKDTENSTKRSPP